MHITLRAGLYLRWISLYVRAAIAEGVSVTLRWLRKLLHRVSPPRPGDTAVSVRWLTRELVQQGILPCTSHVTAAEPSSLSGNRGMVGVMTRLTVTYDPPCKTAPSTFILKMSQPGIAKRIQVMGGGQYREALFYNSTVMQARVPLGLLPACYYASGSGMWGEYSLLLEDCGPEATPVNLVFGNQVWGVPKPVIPARDPVEVLTSMFVRAADLHAVNWCNKDLLQTPWLKGASWYKAAGRLQWEVAMERARAAWATAKAKFGVCAGAEGIQVDAEEGDVRLSPRLVDIVERSLASASWKGLQAHLRDPAVPFTLCHGDFHAANMFLRPHTGNSGADGTVVPTPSSAVVLFDWSEVGPWEPTADLAQTVISDVRPALFTRHSRACVRAYWDTLVTHPTHPVDPTAYPFTACWSAFCRGGPERWIWVFAMIASFPVPTAAVQYFHDQLLAFIDAHEPQDVYVLKPVVCMG